MVTSSSIYRSIALCELVIAAGSWHWMIRA
jgi:hypothetical protein